MPLMG